MIGSVDDVIVEGFFVVDEWDHDCLFLVVFWWWK